MEEDEKDFKVTDKRISFDEAQAAGEKKRAEEERPKAAPEKGKAKVIREKVAEQEEGLQARLPHIDFSSFIFSLAHSALIQLGEEADPFTGASGIDLPQAQETIDLLSVLEEKTRGNLTKDEETLMKNLLYTLRMKYMEKTKKMNTSK